MAARALGEASTHYDATLGDVADAGCRWSQTAAAAGWAANTRIHAVGDGAPWLATQARERFGKN
ncbi:MAG: ISKra4 family transposase, partial [Verrucomicrobia bacterium]